MGKITRTITADSIADLALLLQEMRASHADMATSAPTQKTKAREEGIAYGLELAIGVVRDSEITGKGVGICPVCRSPLVCSGKLSHTTTEGA